MALPVDLLLTRTELPQDGARLNPAHPLAGRFVTAYLPGVSSDNLGFGGPGGIVGNAHSRSAIPAGPTLRLSGSGANATTNRSYGPTPSYPLTMVVVCRQSNNTTSTIAALAAASAISGSFFYIGGGSSTILTFAARNAFGTTLALNVTVPADSAGNQAIGQDLVIVLQSLSASDHRICVNSSAVATSTTNIGSMVAWDRLLIGQTSGTTGLDVAAVLFAHGGTALTDAQMRQLASHPREVWELFEPQRLSVLAPAAAGGDATLAGTTLTATASIVPGSLQASGTLSGTTLTATASLLPGALQASGTIAGTTLTATASIVPGELQAGSTIAGQTLTATASLLPGVLTGQGDATIAGQTLTATASLLPGSLTSTGNTVTINGTTLTATASLISGAFAYGNTMPGQTLTATASLLPGVLFDASASAGGARRNKMHLRIGLGL